MNLTQIVDTSSEVLVKTVVEKTVATIIHKWKQNQPAHIVITGGRTGTKIAQELNSELTRALHDSSLQSPRLHIWLSDERFVNSGSEDRIDRQLIPCFEPLKKFKSRDIDVHIHRIDSAEDTTVEIASENYARELDTVIGDQRFDAVILSLGEDGHVASLFPGCTFLTHGTPSAIYVLHSPKPPSQRVSIGLDRLANASSIYIFALGESKREALTHILNDEAAVPVNMILSAATIGSMVIATDLK